MLPEDKKIVRDCIQRQVAWGQQANPPTYRVVWGVWVEVAGPQNKTKRVSPQSPKSLGPGTRAVSHACACCVGDAVAATSYLDDVIYTNKSPAISES